MKRLKTATQCYSEHWTIPIMATWMRKFALVTCSLTLIVLAVGCGVDRSPMAVSDETAAPAAERIKSGGLYASVETTVEATYTTDNRTATGLFGLEGGNLTVVDKNGKGKKDDIEVALMVPAGVLTDYMPIAMTVYGEDLNSLIVEFAPAGFVFNQAVDLRIDLGNDLAPNSDVNKITPYHTYADGSVEDMEIYHINRSFYALSIYIKIPGFSRYSLRR